MREYDASLPLIFLHMPKTAGVSIKEVFKEWFGDRLLFHYHSSEMPFKYDLVGMHSKESPIALYGHFNSARGFGIKQYYPQVEQFITFLRDPYERFISSYFYTKKIFKGKSKALDKNMRDYVFDMEVSMLNHFPCTVTFDNYKEIIETQFIEVGVTERIDASMMRIASKLNKLYQANTLPQLNVTERDEGVFNELREEFMETRALDFAIYNYVLAKYI